MKFNSMERQEFVYVLLCVYSNGGHGLGKCTVSTENT